MKMISSGNSIVDEVGKIPFTGNVLANNWFNTIKMPNGKPDTISIILLSEIVYWYKPREVKDEKTGMFLGYKKKFKADLLQRSYESFSNQFGFTKRQVKDSCKRLEDLGLITRHFRTVANNGMPLSNVLFIELHSEKLKGVTLESGGCDVITSEGVHLNVRGGTLERQTYTEITTKTTQEITQDKKDIVGQSPTVDIPYFEIIDYLNQQTDSKYKAEAKKNRSLITARWNEGYRLEDFKHVIDVKTEEWINTDMEKYLCPDTLFSNKFEKYSNQKLKKKAVKNNSNEFNLEDFA